MNKNINGGNEERMPFAMKNYVVMLVGVILIFLGFILMSGAYSDRV